jgi:hypothetical protein
MYYTCQLHPRANLDREEVLRWEKAIRDDAAAVEPYSDWLEERGCQRRADEVREGITVW